MCESSPPPTATSSATWPTGPSEGISSTARAVALSRGGVIHLEHLPPDMVAAPGGTGEETGGEAGIRPLGEAVEQFERQYIQQALARTGGHRTRAAALLGISRKSLWERLRETTERRRSGDGEGSPS